MFDIGDRVLLLSDVPGVIQFPNGGGAGINIHLGDVLNFRGGFGDFFEFENITSQGIYRIRWMWFSEHLDRWRVLKPPATASPTESLPKNNDGREYCFVPSCLGKTTKKRGFDLDVYDVCTRCGK